MVHKMLFLRERNTMRRELNTLKT